MNKVVWSYCARQSYLNALEFILLKWTVKEALKLEKAVNELIIKLQHNQRLCPKSLKVSVRKCVVSKQTSMIYQVNRNDIVIIDFLDNRSDHIF